MINPPPPRYPGPNRPPTNTDLGNYMQAADLAQTANPANFGTIGGGIDTGGLQLRDWGTDPILARITGHSSDNIYSFVEVFLSDDAGTYITLPGGITGTDTAFEVNGSSTVTADPDTGLIVELWPNYGIPGFWSFTDAGGGSGSGDPWFWGEITAHSGTEPTATYSWKKKELVLGAWTDAAGPITGTDNLYRAPSNVAPPAIPNGQIVLMRPSLTDPGNYECPASGGITGGSVAIPVYTWDPDTCTLTQSESSISITGRDVVVS